MSVYAVKLTDLPAAIIPYNGQPFLTHTDAATGKTYPVVYGYATLTGATQATYPVGQRLVGAVSGSNFVVPIYLSVTFNASLWTKTENTPFGVALYNGGWIPLGTDVTLNLQNDWDNFIYRSQKSTGYQIEGVYTYSSLAAASINSNTPSINAIAVSPYLLDRLTSAGAAAAKHAWGLRKLKSSYNGPLIQVQEVLPNNTLGRLSDVYPNESGDLNIPDLFDSTSTNVLIVNKIYNQITSTVDRTRGSATDMPYIINGSTQFAPLQNNGIITVDVKKPVVYFSNGGNLVSGALPGLTSPFSWYMSTGHLTTASIQRTATFATTAALTNYLLFHYGGNGKREGAIYFGSTATNLGVATAATTGQSAWIATQNATAINTYKNGTLLTTVNTTGSTASFYATGVNGSQAYPAEISRSTYFEDIIFNAELSAADIATISNDAIYYGI